MAVLLKNGKVYYKGKFINTQVLFDKKIIALGEKLAADTVVDCKGAYITPGFIDIHIHGREGFDAASDVAGVARTLPKCGVTSFLPTTLTLSYKDTLNALKSISKAIDSGVCGAEPLGIYSEGIFFSKEKCGAQNPDNIRETIDMDFVRSMIDAAGGKIKVMAYAPENMGSEELTEFLCKNGVRASMGHSNALAREVYRCLEKGLSGVTHLYNGMRWMNHLELGISGVGVFDDRLYAELITDGYHVNKEFINILFKFKPIDKIIFISDNVPLSGTPEGKGEMGGVPVIIHKDKLEVDGGNTYSLAGSCLRLCDSIKNVISFTGLPAEDVLKCVTENPAEYIGVSDRKGSIEVGYDADINIFDKDFNLKNTYVKGELV